MVRIYLVILVSMDANANGLSEFFNTCQYNLDYVIGRNCRFLQGNETSRVMISRLKEAIIAGEEINETVLNYRRDGSAFMNLLMIAPLYDNKGQVRYYLGCQIDVTPLLEGGKGLDSFAELLAQDSSDSKAGASDDQDAFNLLAELGEMLNEPEADFLRGKLKGDGHNNSTIRRRPATRRVLSSDGDHHQRNTLLGRAMWPEESLGSSGRLPGVYRNVSDFREDPLSVLIN